MNCVKDSFLGVLIQNVHKSVLGTAKSMRNACIFVYLVAFGLLYRVNNVDFFSLVNRHFPN